MIEVRSSTIPCAGDGVFAICNIPINYTLEHYTGTIVDPDKPGGTLSDKLMTLFAKPPWWPDKTFTPITIDGAIGGN